MKKYFVIGVLSLIILDQGIKILIYKYFMDLNFEIIPSWLEFKPFFNSRYSYVNNLMDDYCGLYMGLGVHLLIYFMGEFVLIALYLTFRKRVKKMKKLLDIAFIFQIAALAGALLGNLVWADGVLDYVYLKPWFIFDLKDVYNCCFLGLYLWYVGKNWKDIKHLKIKEIADSVSQTLRRGRK